MFGQNSDFFTKIRGKSHDFFLNHRCFATKKSHDFAKGGVEIIPVISQILTTLNHFWPTILDFKIPRPFQNFEILNFPFLPSSTQNLPTLYNSHLMLLADLARCSRPSRRRAPRRTTYVWVWMFRCWNCQDKEIWFFWGKSVRRSKQKFVWLKFLKERGKIMTYIADLDSCMKKSESLGVCMWLSSKKDIELV